MPNWRITAFDRTLARGICTSGIGALPFDASVALVDDFTLGEEVDVSLRRLPDGKGASYEVTRIAPTGWRSPFTAASVSVAGTALEHFLPSVVGRRAWLATAEDDGLCIQVEDDSYCPQRALVFAGVIFVQCPTEIDAIATIHAFAPAEVLRLAPELVRHESVGWRDQAATGGSRYRRGEHAKRGPHGALAASASKNSASIRLR